MRITRALAIGAMALLAVTSVGVTADALSLESATVTQYVANARLTAGLPALESNDALVSLAQWQAGRMRDYGVIFHNTALSHQVTADDLEWSVVGENVGVGPTIERVEQAFLASSTHRRNILDGRFNAIGVGVVRARDRVYIAQVFARLGSMARPSVTVPSIRPGYVLAEDGTYVPASFYRHSCWGLVMAENHRLVPRSFFGGC